MCYGCRKIGERLPPGEVQAGRKRKVTNRSSISRAGIVAVLAAVYWLLPTAWAQDSGEDVHVTPRVEPMPETGQAADNPTLKTHTKPIKVDVNLVLVPVSIVDPENRQVTGLGEENFEVFEGKERQQIQVALGEDAPVLLEAIFDVSGSMASKIERAREAVVEFFKIANPEDEFFMIAFNDRPEEVTDFTRSVEDVQGRLLYTVPKGSTAMLDAIYLGLSKMRQAEVWEESTADHL